MPAQIARDIEDGKTIFRLPDTQMEVEVILASSTENAPSIYTIRMRYPRIIHAEIMTHRVFGRNARSSRAVPVAKMIEEIRNDPFVPWHWGKNQKGMQANQECNEPVVIPYGYQNDWDFDTPISREDAWFYACDRSIEVAQAMTTAGYHKQVVNRLLEPFMYIDVLITATEWNNFLWLRDHKDAEPHLQDLARMIKLAIDEVDLDIQPLRPGDWHLPYITDAEYWDFRKSWRSLDASIRELTKISSARCARISYAPFDGDASYEKELARYDLLVSSDRVHASPLEHQATPDTKMNPWVKAPYENPELHGNLTGWIQARKLVPNEARTER